MTVNKKFTFLTTIPANGHHLGLLYEGEVIDVMPIIGFLVYSAPCVDRDNYHVIYPVTAEQVHDDDCQDYILIRPDGKVDVPEDRTYASLSAFKDETMPARLKAKAAK